MKLVIVLFVLFAFTSALNCYTTTNIVCSQTQPTDGAVWNYCPDNALWSKMPCSQLNLYADYSNWKCSQNYLQKPIYSQACGFAYKKEEIAERTAYSSCPITSSPLIACCPSRKTCHDGTTVATVCY